jgi:hypothetical protein
MTIQEIIDELSIEVGGDTSDSDLQTVMFVCLKAGFRRIPALIRQRIFVKQASMTVASGLYENSLASISGFIRERAIWYLDSNNVRVPILPARSIQDFHNSFSPNLYGKPARYMVYNNGGVLYIQFDRRTDQAITVGFDYFAAVSAISLSDNFIGDEQLMECVKGFSMERYYRNYEEDKQKADDNKAAANELLLQLEGDYEAEELSGYVEDVDY